MRKVTPLLLLCLGGSCWGVQPKNPNPSPEPVTPDTSAQNNPPEEKESLLKKVEDLSEKHRKTEQKLEKILSQVESKKSNKYPLVDLDEGEKEDLRKGWEQIESQKASAIEDIKNNAYDSGQEDYSSGIISLEE